MAETTQARIFRIATRGSRLALWQAHFVQGLLASHGAASELVLIETQGDREQDVSFAQMTGQGFFTKAVQDAVLDGRADMAVHSLKDLPSAAFPGLVLAAIPQRVDARDVLLLRPEAHDESGTALPVKEGAVIGTSAARRRAQIGHLRNDLSLALLRGNVPTRIQKLRDGDYDGILLAQAGLQRLELDLSGLHVEVLAPELFVPAPGQGALAIECRSDDDETQLLLGQIHDPAAASTVQVERGLMARFDGGCQLALGAHAQVKGETLSLIAWYEGKMQSFEGPSSGAESLVAEAFAAFAAPGS